MKKCCLVGSVPKDFPFEYGNIKSPEFFVYLIKLANEVDNLIEQGYDYFLTDANIGVNLDSAEMILRAKQKFPNLKLEFVENDEISLSMWKKIDIQRYVYIKHNADKITPISEYKNPFITQTALQFIESQAKILKFIFQFNKPSLIF